MELDDDGAPAMTAATGSPSTAWSWARSLLPQASDYAGLRSTWRADLAAGATVSVVALPLALAFGVTSGLGARAGLVTAIVAGLAAAVFGGSNVQVSGPTGAMTVVLAPLVARFGPDAVAAVGVLAGVVVLAAGVLRLGRFVALIPWPVVEGFTVGIAVIIFLQQVPAAAGTLKPDGENTAVVAVRAIADATGSDAARSGALVALVAVVMLVGPRVRRTLPVSLIAVVAATAAAELWSLPVSRIGALPSSLPAPALPHLSPTRISELFSSAIAVAALAALESLLSAKVADGMGEGPRHDPDRELVGQGMANLLSPLFGGMPATGAIARTAVNVRAGARSRLAAIIHAVLLVAVVFFGADLVARVPLAALAGVLMVTATRMVELHNVRAVLRSARPDALVLVVTAVATVALDLLVAVEIGLAVAAVLALRHVAQSATISRDPLPGENDEAPEHGLIHEHIVSYRLDGALFFGAAQRFLTELVAISDVRVMILRLPDLQVLDATGAQALGEIIQELERRHITVLLKGLREPHRRLLGAVGALERLAHENHVFVDMDAALAHARLHVARAEGADGDGGREPEVATADDTTITPAHLPEAR